tara:strand:- start:206503 stop:206604 length:102 start_codon:yes stop_codon:yes gene_type:complete
MKREKIFVPVLTVKTVALKIATKIPMKIGILLF